MTRSTDASKRGFPRVDLPRSNAVELNFYAEYDWNEQVEKAFEAILPPDGSPFISGNTYVVRGTKHLVTALAFRNSKEAPTELVARVMYDARDNLSKLRIPKKDQRVAEVLSALSDLTVRTSIGCNVEFKFDKIEIDDLWFPLPSSLGGPGGSGDVFEIRGVRGVKVSGDEGNSGDWDYSFTLDRPTSEEVYVDLHFHEDGPYSAGLIADALERGSTLARQLVGASE
jgi:hypothetical protein